jgi:hypothetical protein
VVVGDGVTASHALLCQGVAVGTGAVLQPGVVLSYGVVVAARHTVPSHTTITLCKQLQGQVRACRLVDMLAARPLNPTHAHSISADASVSHSLCSPCCHVTHTGQPI